VLQKIKQDLGERVTIAVFGCPEDHPELAVWREAFDFQVHGILNTPEVSGLFTDSDIFLDLSVYQAFGRTGLEAMARGCAVILPARGGVCEYALHRKNALLVDTDNFEACVQAVEEVVKSPTLRIMLADNGVDTAATYSVQTAALSEMAVLKKALLKKGACDEQGSSALESENERSEVQKQVQGLKIRLTEQGFVPRAKAELSGLAADSSHPLRQKLAAWELALWHASQGTAEDAQKGLEYAGLVRGNEPELPGPSKVALVQAECCGILGRHREGRQVLDQAMDAAFIRHQLMLSAPGRHQEGFSGKTSWAPDQVRMELANLFLAAASFQTSLQVWLEYLNQALAILGLPLLSGPAKDEPCSFDGLRLLGGPHRVRAWPDDNTRELVSVIVPAHNAEKTLPTALDSLLAQTWSEMEILVVDDCSTDQTAQVIQAYVRQDSRVRYLKTPYNQGPYAARNLGLQQAAGALVTCHDADDWSHPDKIAYQAKRLLANKEYVANVSSWARVHDDLTLYRRGNPGFSIQLNISSLMFWRKPVMDRLGFWDSVRFGADTEMYYRLRAAFGPDRVAEHEEALLSFSRTSGNSVTENNKCGYPGFLMGARKEYKESYLWFHAKSKSLYYDFPVHTHLFPVPHIMRPDSNQRDKQLTKAGNLRIGSFAVLYAADFTFQSNARRLRKELFGPQEKQSRTSSAQNFTSGGKHQVGLIQMYSYAPDSKAARRIHPEVRELIHTGQVAMVVYGEATRCDCLVILDPNIMQDKQKYVPEINAHKVQVLGGNEERQDVNISNGDWYVPLQ
jgi:glycosyltransferase involved in cell wall biosynthesis